MLFYLFCMLPPGTWETLVCSVVEAPPQRVKTYQRPMKEVPGFNQSAVPDGRQAAVTRLVLPVVGATTSRRPREETL